MTVRVNALWVGGTLGYLERACLASAVQAGHHVVLYTYQGVAAVPDGVTVLDARAVVPEDRMLRYKQNGSLALGSNLFRYELFVQGLGYWIDADVYFIKPLDPCDGRFVFGWEDDNFICSAVLHIPSGSQLLADLLAFVKSDPIIPPWWPAKDQNHQRSLATEGRHLRIDEMPWATIGPKAVTHFVKANNLVEEAASREIFYPVHWKQADDLFSAEINIWELITEKTKTVHLWNHLIEDYKHTVPPAGSFVGEICRAQGVGFQDTLT